MDHSGEKVGMVTILKKTDRKNDNGDYFYICQCECGKILESLYRKNFVSCGCYKKQRQKRDKSIPYFIKDYSGKIINNILVLNITNIRSGSSYKYSCKCHCGNIFNVRISHLLDGGTKSCGCLNPINVDYSNVEINNIKIIRKSDKQTSYDGTYFYEMECFCGKKFLDIPRKIKNGSKRSCGCLQEKVLFKSGIDNPMYDHALSDKERKLAKRSWLGNFKKQIIKRDSCCVICKNINNLVVHHINGYNWYISGRKDYKNCVTLCKSCHDEFHKIYGKGFNTSDEFDEFIKEKICHM